VDRKITRNERRNPVPPCNVISLWAPLVRGFEITSRQDTREKGRWRIRT